MEQWKAPDEEERHTQTQQVGFVGVLEGSSVEEGDVW